MTNLIIVESPTKARTLERFLGEGYKVQATMGHIKDLPKSKISIDIENNYEPVYVDVEKKSDVIKSIKDAAKKADEIYLATDPDREGEAIAAHVKGILNGQKVKMHRITFHEITKDAVEHAISEPGELNTSLVEAQVARRVLDRLVGYKLSPVLWKKVRRHLSAGRVQSVAVRLIVEKEREIEAFKAIEYWEIFCELKQSGKDKKDSFSVSLSKIDGKKAKVDNEKQAREIESDLSKAGYSVSDVAKKEVRKRPYAPFTTSTLTQTAANMFGWSSKYTMRVAQSLYEQGLITYHRTDSLNVSAKAISEVRKYITKEYGENYSPEKPRFYKTKSKSAQEAHEAIRPTGIQSQNVQTKGKSASADDKLYKLIWRRFVASQMADAVFDQTTIKVAAKNKNDYELSVGGQILKFDGFRKVYGKTSDDVLLPDVKNGEKLDLLAIKSEQKFTQPPARYNEASLIKTLEKLGIGRPSTYAPIISTIQQRKYVEKLEGRFKPTPIGTTVTDFLVKNFPDELQYEFTAKMEGDLDEVAEGKRQWQTMIDEFYKPFEKRVKKAEDADRVQIPVEKLGKKCPTCETEGRKGDNQGELVIRTGRFGKFISCSNFPDCKHTDKYLDKVGMKCPDCKDGEIIIKKTGRGRQFFGCSRYPDCKWASWKDPRQKAKEVETDN